MVWEVLLLKDTKLLVVRNMIINLEASMTIFLNDTLVSFELKMFFWSNCLKKLVVCIGWLPELNHFITDRPVWNESYIFANLQCVAVEKFCLSVEEIPLPVEEIPLPANTGGSTLT